jgi:hypothetical protein
MPPMSPMPLMKVRGSSAIDALNGVIFPQLSILNLYLSLGSVS